MNGTSLRAYRDRAWGLLEDDSERQRAEAYQRDPQWSCRTADALRAAVVAANPGWPTAADRDADFAHHLRLKELIDRASRALTRRRRAR